MPASKRQELAVEAARRNLEQLVRLGGALRDARLRRRVTQRVAASLAGIGRSTAGRIERGRGGNQSMDSWQRYALAVGRPLVVDIGRDSLDEPADAGHLLVQELLLRFGRRLGYATDFESPSRPTDPARSIDVRWRHDKRRLLIVLEAWNTIGDIGAGARSFDRKLADAEAFAIGVGGGRPHRVAGCWVVRSTTRNRALITRYPEVFAARFGGSSERWVRALTTGADPPSDRGLVWCDTSGMRLYAWRRRLDS